MNTKSILSVFAVSALLLTQCGGGDDTANVSTEDTNKVVTTVKDTLPPSTVDGFSQFKFDMLLANLPSPLEIINDLNASKAEYNESLVTDKKKASSVSDHNKQAFFMGAYTVDMSYLIDYDKGTDALGYMTSVKKLSDDLGISKYYDKTFYDRFNGNLGKKDSLMNMVNSAITLTDKFCRSNDNLKTSTYIFTGSWLEGLYMATQVIKDQPRTEQNKAIYARVWQQRFHAKNLLDALETFKTDAGCKNLIPVIKDIQAICDKVQNETDLTQAQVAQVGEKVAKLRELMFGK
ncbi:MAG: hypothetical protein IAF38_19040 [Bacteroidia bacterium]|nr:hypothetical protein [Bacteroidia bacterium]